MNRNWIVRVVGVVGVLLIAGSVTWSIVGSGGDDHPGWENAGRLDDIAPKDFVTGVGNDQVSIVPALATVGDTTQSGVAVTDHETGDITFTNIAETSNGCFNVPRVTVGPAGFVFQSIALQDQRCPDDSDRFAAVSTDGITWKSAQEFDDVEVENPIVFAGGDRFLRLSGGAVTDAVTGDDVATVPWTDDFVPNTAAGSSDGEIVVVGRVRATDDDGGFTTEVGWAANAEGDWSPIVAPPEWIESGIQRKLGFLPETVQATDDGGFRLVWTAQTETLGARSDDGITWTVDDTGIPGEHFVPDVRVLYTSPQRTLISLSTEDRSDPFESSYCFAVTEVCDLPDRLFIEFMDDSRVELRSDEYRGPDSAPYSSVDAGGRYTQLIGRDGLDESIDVMQMTERNEGDVAARFDRLPLEYVIDAEDIGNDRVDLLGEVSDDGATIVLAGRTSVLSRVEDGTVGLEDLRVGNYLQDSADYAMFTAERISNDRVLVHAYPTDDVFGTYQIGG